MGKTRENYEATITRKVRDGRGLGELKSYKPWLDIRDVSSLGRSHIVLSATVGREHHLLSDLEERVLLYLDYSPRVKDIREQFPLFPRAETAAIAEEMGIKHPSHAGSNDVLTEDFLLTLTDSHIALLALQVKYSSELRIESVLQKLELQRRFFLRHGIPWRLITERDLPDTTTHNLKWLRGGSIEMFPVEVSAEFKKKIIDSKPSEELINAIQRAGKSANMGREQAVLLFKRLAWVHEIEIDITVKLELDAPISRFNLRLPDKECGDERAA